MLNPSERVALNWHLSSYRRDDTFAQVLDAVLADDAQTIVWAPIEKLSRSEVCELIEIFEAEIRGAMDDPRAKAMVQHTKTQAD